MISPNDKLHEYEATSSDSSHVKIHPAIAPACPSNKRVSRQSGTNASTYLTMFRIRKYKHLSHAATTNSDTFGDIITCETIVSCV
jgi:hypothetical protein